MEVLKIKTTSCLIIVKWFLFQKNVNFCQLLPCYGIVWIKLLFHDTVYLPHESKVSKQGSKLQEVICLKSGMFLKSDEWILDECFKNELLTFDTRIYFVLFNVWWLDVTPSKFMGKVPFSVVFSQNFVLQCLLNIVDGVSDF